MIKQEGREDEESKEAKDLSDEVTKRRSGPRVMTICKTLADAIAKGRAVQCRENQIMSESQIFQRGNNTCEAVGDHIDFPRGKGGVMVCLCTGVFVCMTCA